MDLKQLNIRFMFAAELLPKCSGITFVKSWSEEPYGRHLNIYGSADIGAMAYETPLAILIGACPRKNGIFEDIFGQIEKTPTLAQYNPDHIEFEIKDSEILLTGNSAVPLIRYAIGDHGGAKSFSDIEKIFVAHGVDLEAEAKKAGITFNRHPFVFVYERTDFSTNLHGINIYPEFIKEGLTNPVLHDKLTQRFTMMTEFDENHVQFLHINVELKKTLILPMNWKIRYWKSFSGLIDKSAEFAEVSGNREGRELIKITLWENGHDRYFTAGTKQKWVEKTQY